MACKWLARLVYVALMIAGPSWAQLEVAATMSVDTLISSLRQQTESLISQTEGAVSRTQFETRSHLLVVLGQLDIMLAKQQGKVWKELDDAERKFFTDARMLIHDADLRSQRFTSSLQTLAETLEMTAGSLFGTYPQLRTMKPSYAISSAAATRLIYTGAFLANHTPSLQLGGTSCAIVSELDTRLEFECPPPTILPDGAQLVRGTLTVYEEQGWWDSWFNDPTPRVLQTGVTYINREIGTLAIQAHGETEADEAVARSQVIGHRNDHCAGDTHLNPTFSPQSNCTIVAPSVSVSERSRSSNSVNGGLRAVTETGFQWSGIARNNGACGPRVFGEHVGLDGRGWIEVDVSWTEKCRRTVSFHNQPVESRKVSWGQSFQVSLPPGSSRASFALESPFGSQAGDTSLTGASSNPLVSVQLSGRTLIVEVSKLEPWLVGE